MGQCHPNHSVDERAKEVPRCPVSSHARGRHSLRRSWSGRIYGIWIRHPDRRSGQLAPG
jgi:hypothetical protein